MKKNLIKEDVYKMMSLMDYDRSKTLTENKKSSPYKQNLNEADVSSIAQGAGWGALAGSVIPGVGTTLGAAFGGGLAYLIDVFGPKGQSPACSVVLSPSTWATVVDGIQSMAYEAGLDRDFLWNKVKVIPSSTRRAYATTLFEAMDGGGTDYDAISGVYNANPTQLDDIAISSAFGTRSGTYTSSRENLEAWIDGDLSASNKAAYVCNIITKKPYINFDGKDYTSVEDFTKAAAEAVAKEVGIQEAEAANTELMEKFKSYPCVQKEIQNDTNTLTYPYKDDERKLLIVKENGDKLLVTTTGRYYAYIDGQGEGPGNISCPGDIDIDIEGGEGDIDVEVDESRMLNEIFNLFENDWGGIKLTPDDAEESEEESEEESGDSSGGSSGGSSYSRTDLTYEDVVACKGEFKRGDRGQGVKKAQTELNKSDKVNPKLKVDGIFGPKTEAAIAQAGGSKVFNCDLAKTLSGGSTGDDTAGQQDEKEIEKEVEKEVNQITTPEEAKQAMEQTKQEIKDLKQQKKDIRRQKRGLKKIQKMCKKFPNLEQCKDTQSLQEWYLR